MIVSLRTALTRVLFFWYSIGLFFLFLGPSQWAQVRYERLMQYTNVPQIELKGLSTALQVQVNMLLYWTIPVLCVWAVALVAGGVLSEIKMRLNLARIKKNKKPSGQFFGVSIYHFSLGSLPLATVPRREGLPVVLVSGFRLGLKSKKHTYINVKGDVAKVLGWLTPEEKALSQELLEVLLSAPNHYAGAGHGVGLLEHTFNVLSETAKRCTEEKRLPFIAAIAHDIGKLMTFQKNEDGEWERVGYHSRASGRIISTMPSFEKLPVEHQRALILAIKYDHSPEKMPTLADDSESFNLAHDIIFTLSAADRSATAGEKDRNLEKLNPEELLWQDFVKNLRDAPMAQRGQKRDVANQINNPPNSPYFLVYEAPWRDEAIKRLPEEVAAALDLTRRDKGKLAKYTEYLVSRLRKEGLLVESFVDAKDKEWSTDPSMPLWDIMSGKTEFKGVIVLRASELWSKLNYRIGRQTPYQIELSKPTLGDANERASHSSKTVHDVSDMIDLKEENVTSLEVGLIEEGEVNTSKPVKRNRRARFGINALVEESAKKAPTSSVQNGILIADSKAIEQYPWLKENQQYYSKDSPAVVAGTPEGAAYPFNAEEHAESLAKLKEAEKASEDPSITDQKEEESNASTTETVNEVAPPKKVDTTEEGGDSEGRAGQKPEEESEVKEVPVAVDPDPSPNSSTEEDEDIAPTPPTEQKDVERERKAEQPVEPKAQDGTGRSSGRRGNRRASMVKEPPKENVERKASQPQAQQKPKTVTPDSSGQALRRNRKRSIGGTQKL